MSIEIFSNNSSPTFWTKLFNFFTVCPFNHFGFKKIILFINGSPFRTLKFSQPNLQFCLLKFDLRKFIKPNNHQNLCQMSQIRHRIQNFEYQPNFNFGRSHLDALVKVQNATSGPKTFLFDHGHRGGRLMPNPQSGRRFSTGRTQVLSPLGWMQIHLTNETWRPGSNPWFCKFN